MIRTSEAAGRRGARPPLRREDHAPTSRRAQRALTGEEQQRRSSPGWRLTATRDAGSGAPRRELVVDRAIRGRRADP